MFGLMDLMRVASATTPRRSGARRPRPRCSACEHPPQISGGEGSNPLRRLPVRCDARLAGTFNRGGGCIPTSLTIGDLCHHGTRSPQSRFRHHLVSSSLTRCMTSAFLFTELKSAGCLCAVEPSLTWRGCLAVGRYSVLNINPDLAAWKGPLGKPNWPTMTSIGRERRSASQRVAANGCWTLARFARARVFHMDHPSLRRKVTPNFGSLPF